MIKEIFNKVKNFITKYYKILLPIIILLLVIIIVINIISRSKVKPILKTIEVGSNEIDLTNPYSFVKTKKKLSYCMVESNLDINKVGKYKYKIVCEKKTYGPYKIRVVDTTVPTTIVKNLAIVPGTEVKAEDFFLYIYDLSGYKLKFETDFDINGIGVYGVQIKVSDKYKNSKEVVVDLTVAEDAPVKTLICDRASDIDMIQPSYYVSLNNQDNIYDILRVVTFKYDNDKYYMEDKESYSNTGLISGYDGEAKIEDHLITMYKYISDVDYKNEFGIDYQPKNKDDIYRVFNNNCKEK